MGDTETNETESLDQIQVIHNLSGLPTANTPRWTLITQRMTDLVELVKHDLEYGDDGTGIAISAHGGAGRTRASAWLAERLDAYLLPIDFHRFTPTLDIAAERRKHEEQHPRPTSIPRKEGTILLVSPPKDALRLDPFAEPNLIGDMVRSARLDRNGRLLGTFPIFRLNPLQSWSAVGEGQVHIRRQLMMPAWEPNEVCGLWQHFGLPVHTAEAVESLLMGHAHWHTLAVEAAKRELPDPHRIERWLLSQQGPLAPVWRNLREGLRGTASGNILNSYLGGDEEILDKIDPRHVPELLALGVFEYDDRGRWVRLRPIIRCWYRQEGW